MPASEPKAHTMTTARIVARNVLPMFAHDCTRCTFLGSLDGADLYHCPDHGGELIARHSNRPSDYGCFSLDMRIAPPKGSPYALALVLYALGSARKMPTNAYKSRAVSTVNECNGCEHCDGEGGTFGPHHPRPEARA